MAQAPRRFSIADALGLNGAQRRDLTQSYGQAVNRPAPRTTGTLKAARPTAAQELAQLLTPDTRFGAELAAKIEPAVEMSPLGLLTGLVDARRQYQAGNIGQAAGAGIFAALSAIPSGKSVKIGGKMFKNFPTSEDAYIEAINPGLKRIAESDRPNLGMGDMYGMAPKSAKKIKSIQADNFGKVDFVSDGENVYALGFNPDLGEIDVLGYAMKRGDDTTELAVANELQGLGIGSELSYLYRSMNPLAKSGGLTEKGERAARRSYRRMMEGK